MNQQPHLSVSVAQLAEASPSNGEGSRFESGRGYVEPWEEYAKREQEQELERRFGDTDIRQQVECMTCWALVLRESRRLHWTWHENSGAR